MIIGTTTTDGVTKVKTKTTDGVVKAVACACCNTACDPAALWGPGYDDQPGEIELFDYTLTRFNKCLWKIEQCLCPPGAGEEDAFWFPSCEASECPDEYGPFLRVDLVQYYPNAPIQAIYWAESVSNPGFYYDGTANRTGGDYPPPFGDYIVESINEPFNNLQTVGDTFTISPP